MRSAVLIVAVVLFGCGTVPSDEPLQGDSATGSVDGSSNTAGTSEATGGEGSSGSSMQPLCEPELTRAPEFVQARSVDWTIFHAAAGSSGIYLAGPVSTDGARADVQISRIDETGAELWTARWGSVLGWDDTPSALLPVEEGVLVAGVAGLYPSQE